MYCEMQRSFLVNLVQRLSILVMSYNIQYNIKTYKAPYVTKKLFVGAKVIAKKFTVTFLWTRVELEPNQNPVVLVPVRFSKFIY